MISYDDSIKDLIRRIRSAGAYLQENAEDIVIKKPYLAHDGVRIYLNLDRNGWPSIEVDQEIIVPLIHENEKCLYRFLLEKISQKGLKPCTIHARCARDLAGS